MGTVKWEKVSDNWIETARQECYCDALTDSPLLVTLYDRNRYCGALDELKELRQTMQRLNEEAQNGISNAGESMTEIKALEDRAYNSAGFGAQQGIQETWHQVLAILEGKN